MVKQALFDQWTTYAKVVAGDYMHQQVYFSELVQFLRISGTTTPTKSLQIIDLGCGDAQPILPVLAALPAHHYVGIDESAAALERARANLSRQSASFELIEGAMQERIAELTHPADVVIASYSLHHLPTLQKQQVLDVCRRLLAPDGTMAIVDVFRHETESSAAYFDRWESNAKMNFSSLAAAEVAELVTHVRENDLPETVGTYQQLAAQAGFVECRELMVGPAALNRLLVLR